MAVSFLASLHTEQVTVHARLLECTRRFLKAVTEVFLQAEEKRNSLTDAKFMKISAQARCDICGWRVKNLVLLQRECSTFFLAVKLSQNTLQGGLIKHESTNRLSCVARENSHQLLPGSLTTLDFLQQIIKKR